MRFENIPTTPEKKPDKKGLGEELEGEEAKKEPKEQIEEARKEMDKDLEAKTEKIKMETFGDYFNKSSALFNEVENLKPEEAGRDHPYIKFLKNFGDVRKSIDSVLAKEILEEDELALYQKHQEGAKAFGLTKQDWEEKKSDNWKEWSRSCEINNQLIFTIEYMQKSEKIPEIYREKINKIPDALKQKLVNSIKQGEELLKELKEQTEKDNKKKIEQKLNPQNIDLAIKSGRPIKVKVKRASGEIEDGWVISDINPETGEAKVLKFISKEGKDRSFVDKIVTLEELKEWNKSETKEPKEQKEETGKKKPEKKEEHKEEKEEKGEKEKEKEDLEKEITKNFYDELKKIKDTPGLKMEKTEKYFQLIENWQDLAYLDNYKGIKDVFSELDKLKPSIWFYNLKKARITNSVAKSMASNYEEWDLEDKEKLKIIKNFVNKQSKEKNFLSSFFYSKDKTLKEIAQILALKDIPYKNNIDVIVKEIENPDIKAETIAGMIDIEKQSIEKNEQSLQALKEDMKRDKLPPDKIIIEQLKKLGVDPEVFSKILSKVPELVEALKHPEVQGKIQELRNTIEKITKGEEGKEIPEAVKKVKEHIKDEKESPWKTAFGVAGWSILLFLVLFMLAELKGVDLLTGAAGGKKKKLDKK